MDGGLVRSGSSSDSRGRLPRVGDYQPVRELARGGMGVVYEAVHEPTGARHAVKTILGGPLGADVEDLHRFRREAEVMGRLDHPHIVRIHAASLVGPAPWLAQDLLPGGSLEQRLARGPLPVDEAVSIARKLASALAHAHAREVLHRDLKPANILFDELDEPRLVDFGLGLSMREGSVRLTQSGAVLGTPVFMAPEQARGGRDEDPRTDVYGLGATLYAMLTGRPPFAGASHIAVMQAVLVEDVAPLRRLRPEVPMDVAAVLARAMAKDPADRYPDMRAFEEALRGTVLEPERRPPPSTPTRWLVGAASGTTALALLALGSVWARRPSPAPVDADTSAVTTRAEPPRPPRATEPPRRPTAPSAQTLRDLELAVEEGNASWVHRLIARGGALEPATARRLALKLLEALRPRDHAAAHTTFYGHEDAAWLIELAAVVGAAQALDPTLPPFQPTALRDLLFVSKNVMQQTASEQRAARELADALLAKAPRDVLLRFVRGRVHLPDDGALDQLLALCTDLRPVGGEDSAAMRGECLFVIREHLRRRGQGELLRTLLEEEAARDDASPRVLALLVEQLVDVATPATADLDRAAWLMGRARAHPGGGTMREQLVEVGERLAARRAERGLPPAPEGGTTAPPPHPPPPHPPPPDPAPPDPEDR